MPGAGLEQVKLDSLFVEYHHSILDYSLLTFGYHVYNFFSHLFIHPRTNDFEEMLLHHIAAFCLYFCYIYGNLVPFGAVIAYLHDLADVFGNLCKALNSSTYQDSSAFFFVMCMIVWFATRCIILPQMIYCIFNNYAYGPGLEHYQPFVTLNGVFLSVMLCLHYFWFAMFCKILSRYIIKGETEDTQNKVVKEKKED